MFFSPFCFKLTSISQPMATLFATMALVLGGTRAAEAEKSQNSQQDDQQNHHHELHVPHQANHMQRRRGRPRDMRAASAAITQAPFEVILASTTTASSCAEAPKETDRSASDLVVMSTKLDDIAILLLTDCHFTSCSGFVLLQQETQQKHQD
jgi:hypothetical protein